MSKVTLKLFSLALLMFGSIAGTQAQVGVGTNTPDKDAALEVNSSVKGLLLPRVALQATDLAAPLQNHVAGMVVYNTATAGTGTTAVAPGIYVNDGTKWQLAGVGGGGTVPVTEQPPVALDLQVAGNPMVNSTVTASYTYSSAAGAAESGTVFQWYTATSASGANSTPIVGATGKTYVIVAGDEGKFIGVRVVPGAATGPTPGLGVVSTYVQVVATFMFDGLTYGTVKSTKSGYIWLDRNIGALRVPQTQYDQYGYGDLYQWGRPKDGHETINWTSSKVGVGVNGTTTTLAPTDVPTTNAFIISPSGLQDWSENPTLQFTRWETNPQGPCPPGFVVPTRADWSKEGFSSSGTAWSSALKLPSAGWRLYNTGNVTGAGDQYNSEYAARDYMGGSPRTVEYGSSNRNDNPRGAATAASVRCVSATSSGK